MFCSQCGRALEKSLPGRLDRFLGRFSTRFLKQACIAAAAIAPLVLARQVGRSSRQAGGLLVLGVFSVVLIAGPLVVVWLLNRLEQDGRIRAAQAVAATIWVLLIVGALSFLVFFLVIIYVAEFE